jgi:hypothetical protein
VIHDCEDNNFLFVAISTGNFSIVLAKLQYAEVFSYLPYLLFKFNSFSCVFFGGLECVGHSFAYVAHFVFLRDFWIRTQIAAVASRRAININNVTVPCPDLILLLGKSSRPSATSVVDRFIQISAEIGKALRLLSNGCCYITVDFATAASQNGFST